VGIFLTLETLAFVFNLAVLSPNGWKYDELGLRNFGFTVDLFHIAISCILLLLMMLYCVMVIMYICKLRDDEAANAGRADDSLYGDYDDGDTHIAAPRINNKGLPSGPASTGDITSVVSSILSQKQQAGAQTQPPNLVQKSASLAAVCTTASTATKGTVTDFPSVVTTLMTTKKPALRPPLSQLIKQPPKLASTTNTTILRDPYMTSQLTALVPNTTRYQIARYQQQPYRYGPFDRGYSYSNNAINVPTAGETDQWGQPRVQALRYNYYNTYGGRRTVAFLDDYGVEV